MQTNCNTCHNTTTASGGWITDNYTNLKTIATNGKLYGAVSHASGFSFMPQNANKLNDCDIAKIKKWIDSGSPNN
jgi:cytochrome c553